MSDTSAIYLAFLHNPCVYSKILEFGINYEQYSKFYRVCDCILRNDKEVAKILLCEIDDVDFKNTKEITLLRFALLKSNLKFAKLFLERGADVNAKETNEIASILSDGIKKMNCSAEMVQLLVDAGGKVNDFDNDSNPVFEAAARGRSDLLEVLLAQLTNFNWQIRLKVASNFY